MSVLLKKMNLNYPQLTNELFQAYFKDLANIGAIPRPTVVKGKNVVVLLSLGFKNKQQIFPYQKYIYF